MSRRISYKLHIPEWEAAYKFYRELGLPPEVTMEEFAKKCLFYAINDATNKAREIRAQEEATNGQSSSQNPTGDTAEQSGSEDANPDILADEAESRIPTTDRSDD